MRRHETTRSRHIRRLLKAGLMLAAVPAMAAAEGDIPGNPTRNAYFGDLHLHTGMSFDASLASGITKGPETAYRFARGHEVTVIGRTVKRHAPLDFLAVTDHAEYLGVVHMASDPDGYFAGTEWPERMEGEGLSGEYRRRVLTSGFYGTVDPIDDFLTEEVKTINWQKVIDAAEQYYEPGKFTTFAAFEWSNTPDNAHFHRVSIFKGPDYPDVPFSALDSRHPEDLWRYADNNRENGIDSVLIPHNSNLSDGLMFAYTDSYGAQMDRAFAEMKQRNERLVEVTQVKGTSETHPELSPTDEFADFELMNHYFYDNPDELYRPIHGSYVREGLGRGLEIQSEVGVNPYKLGMVGASDFHLAVSGTEEFNFTGALGADNIDAPEQLFDTSNTQSGGVLNGPLIKLGVSGITGVWAEKNTRESIFNALKRREAFATSGPRIRVRMFAGWTYPAGLVHRNDWLSVAYEDGVPMGADLAPPAEGGKPRFLFEALKDPDSGNLDRIQVVKVWYEGSEAHEEVHDVVWSGDRQPDRESGKVPAVGNSVDLATATYTNDTGAVQLSGEWVDADFDPGQAAIYYARVIEIPTPRWTTHLAVKSGLPLPEEVPATIQERAWTSPIFYTPEGFGEMDGE